MREIPSRAEDMTEEARSKLNDTMTAVTEKARYAVRMADRRVQASPWAAVGIGFGAGVVFGALLSMAINSQRSYLDRL